MIPDTHSETAVLAALVSEALQVDPSFTPEAVARYGRAIWTWRTVDADLAGLADLPAGRSGRPPLGSRSDPARIPLGPDRS